MRVRQYKLLCLIVSVSLWLILMTVVPAAQPADAPDSTIQTAGASMVTGFVGQIALNAQPTFGLDQIPMLQQEIDGYPLWQYVASLLWILLAFAVAALLDYLMANKLHKLAAKTQTDLDEKLLEVLRGPVKAAIFLMMLNVGIRMFQWPDWVETILSGLFVIAMACVLAYLAIRLERLRSLLARYFRRLLVQEHGVPGISPGDGRDQLRDQATIRCGRAGLRVSDTDSSSTAGEMIPSFVETGRGTRVANRAARDEIPSRGNPIKY